MQYRQAFSKISTYVSLQQQIQDLKLPGLGSWTMMTITVWCDQQLCVWINSVFQQKHKKERSLSLFFPQ